LILKGKIVFIILFFPNVTAKLFSPWFLLFTDNYNPRIWWKAVCCLCGIGNSWWNGCCLKSQSLRSELWKSLPQVSVKFWRNECTLLKWKICKVFLFFTAWHIWYMQPALVVIFRSSILVCLGHVFTCLSCVWLRSVQGRIKSCCTC
jgi:hypothetical protein